MPHLREGNVDRRRVPNQQRGLAGGDGRPRDALEAIVGEREERAVREAGGAPPVDLGGGAQPHAVEHAARAALQRDERGGGSDGGGGGRGGVCGA